MNGAKERRNERGNDAILPQNRISCPCRPDQLTLGSNAKGEENIPLGFGSTGSGKLIYAKPFLSAPKATTRWLCRCDVQQFCLAKTWTTQAVTRSANNGWYPLSMRTSPIISSSRQKSRLNEAGRIAIPQSATNDSDGSIQIEFAQLDYLVNEIVNLRAGILLMPVGKFNLLHDSPLNDLVDRPMVSRIIIPEHLVRSRRRHLWHLYPSSQSKLDYEVYAVNGMSQHRPATASPTWESETHEAACPETVTTTRPLSAVLPSARC